jgi:type II secretory pathway pseudopilin PulG
MEDQGGWLWLIIDVIFVAILGAALVWGTLMWRSRRQRAHTEQATRDMYRRAAENERRGAGS